MLYRHNHFTPAGAQSQVQEPDAGRESVTEFAEEIFEAAKAYIQQGFAVIPIARGTKKPVIGLTGWQERRYTIEELEPHFDAGAQIGIVTGKLSGNLVVLDFDGDGWREAYTALVAAFPELNSEACWTVETGSGKRHIWVCCDDLPEDFTRATFRREFSNATVEVRANRHYVVAPPSLHPSGARYRWIHEPGAKLQRVSFQRLMKWLNDWEREGNRETVKSENVKSKNGNGTPDGKWLDAFVALLTPYWQQGYRHDLALGLAGMMSKKGVKWSEAEEAFRALLEKTGDPEWKDRLRALKDTYERLDNGDSVIGFTRVAEILSEEIAKAIDSLIPDKRIPRQLFTTFGRPEHPCTDMGNAERLISLFGCYIRWVPQWGWLVWDGRRWKRSTEGVEEFARETVRRIYEEAASIANPEERQKVAKWAMASESKQRIEAMIAVARSMVVAEPDEFDADGYLLNVANGIVDLRTGELLPHNPEMRLTKIAPVAYNPEAKAPTWERFLKDVFCGDEELIAFVQRALGYSLTGDVSEDAFFIAWGTGSNGKTTLFSVVQEILGDYARSIAPDVLMKRRDQSDSHPTGLAQLCGVRFAVAQETEEGKQLSAARVKAITSRDKIVARFMRKDYFEFTPTHKIWLVTNHKPIITDTTYGFWRRVYLIPFTAFFDETRRDTKMKQKLLAEAEGILAWLVKGCLEWQRMGLNPPAIVREATEAYRTESDMVGCWLEERCIADPEAKTPFAELYADYVEWCKQQDEEPLGKRAFGNRLTEKGFEPVVLSSGAKGRKGLRLKHDGGHKPERTPDEPTPKQFSDEGGSAELPNCRSFRINPLNEDAFGINAEISAERQNSRDSGEPPSKPSGAPSAGERCPECGDILEQQSDGTLLCLCCGAEFRNPDEHPEPPETPPLEPSPEPETPNNPSTPSPTPFPAQMSPSPTSSTPTTSGAHERFTYLDDDGCIVFRFNDIVERVNPNELKATAKLIEEIHPVEIPPVDLKLPPTLVLDIEVDDSPAGDGAQSLNGVERLVENADKPILAVGFKVVADGVNKEEILFNDGDEKKLLERAAAFIERFARESGGEGVLTGYNLCGFDLPYLVRRAQKLNVKFPFRFAVDKNSGDVLMLKIAETEGTLRGEPLRVPKVIYCGDGFLDIVDTFWLVLRYDFTARELPSYSLKDVARHFGVEEPDRVFIDAGNFTKTFKQTPEAFKAYLRADLRETFRLFEKLIPSHLAVARIVSEIVKRKVNLSFVTSKGKTRIWGLLLESAYGVEYVKRLKPDEKVNYPGGLVAAHKGYFTDVAKIDVASLYPTIMMSWRVRSHKDVNAVMLRMLRSFTAERLKYKQIAKQQPNNFTAKALSDGLKLLINSAYGVLGAEGFVFNDMRAAARVTEIGRKIATIMTYAVEEEGGVVIEVDTDGILFSHPLPERVLERLSQLLPPQITVEPEGCGMFAFVSDRKNYILVKPDGSVIAKGSKWRGRDKPKYATKFAPEFVRKRFLEGEDAAFAFAREVFEAVVSGNGWDWVTVTRKVGKGNADKFLKRYGFREGERVTFAYKDFKKKVPAFSNEEGYDVAHYKQELLEVFKELGIA